MMTRFAVFSLALGLSFQVMAAENPQLVPVALAKAYVPVGFDDNDLAQVMVAGVFSDTCHKLGPTKVKFDESSRSFVIEQMAMQYSDICLRMVVPFATVVNLGIVKEGDFALTDGFSKAQIGGLSITHSKSQAADDYLYAPVSDADIYNADGKQFLTLRGAFTNRCSKLKEVRIFTYTDSVVVQPIMEFIDSERCGYEKIRFEHKTEIENPVKGTHLLHVRVTNGNSINKLLDLP